MDQHIYRSHREPIRPRIKLSWEELWEADDKGLIVSWEIGRELGEKKSELKVRALDGELPYLLGMKGSTENTINQKKYGPILYLAQWQGLRGDDLDIYPHKETTLTCSKTKTKVTYTNDYKKFSY